jgi:hypothetical protein
VLVHFNDIILLAGGTAAEPEALCMANECREVVRVYRVDDVEEELSIWAIGRGLLLGEELAQIWYGHDIFYQCLNAQFVIVRNLYRPDLISGDELLLSCEHLLEKVFVDFLYRGHVVLPYTN